MLYQTTQYNITHQKSVLQSKTKYYKTQRFKIQSKTFHLK